MTCYFDTPIAVLKHFLVGANAVWPGSKCVLNRSMLRDYEKAYGCFSDSKGLLGPLNYVSHAGQVQ